jgi:hypothetical protein
MSDLLNKASLVMIPSGYKEDTVYSVVPSDGSGDLSFTRASNGTRINSAGLVEVCPWNLMSQSNAFSTSPWLRTNTTLTSGQSDPNGGSNAWKVEFASGNAYLGQFGIGQIGVVTISAYFRADSTTTIGFNDGSAYPNSITIGTTWQRYEFSYLVSGSQCNMQIDNYFGVSPSSQAKTFYIYGAQLNIGSTAKPYFPTTDRLNVPRLTYQNGGGGCPSLLLEKQSTNVETWSEDFSNASWTKTNCSITANTTTSPDGTQNADKIIENSINGVHFVYNVGATISVAQTLSVYAKADTRTQLALQLGASSVIYNLSSGTIVSGSGGAIENAGNGWYRCSITTTPANTNALIFTANGGTNSYQGDGTSGLFIWGAQLEVGSYATSLINTTSSSATRVADACFKTGISSLIGQTEGVVFIDVIWRTTGQTFQSASVNSGNYFNSISFGYLNGTGLRLEIYYGGSALGLGTKTLTDGERYKIAFAYKSGDSCVYINGVQFSTNTNTFSFGSTLSRIDLSFANEVFGDKINQAILFKTRLTNSELASLTTI